MVQTVIIFIISKFLYKHGSIHHGSIQPLLFSSYCKSEDSIDWLTDWSAYATQ